ncbi:AzlC family ABC transporter permease [Thermomicrobiaceae bacterium CFH 74404]|uniref:AzlC family ABC transporter permease n=1 Tax=Thermalbibacter longus TaxID=2951981 RepID=A0AA41WGV1_9BACT|nr:AzlC family ABC transporter permease [Thermalbibacter longus]MCM8749795.1 AzlC family ABC transporter permease [Thermalbibacter longus]
MLHSAFIRGFRAMLPLWLGAVPSGIAFGFTARHVGLDAFEAQAMSLLVFSAPAQMATIDLLVRGVTPVLPVVVTLSVNAQLALISLACGRILRPGIWPAAAVAFLLTEGSFAVASAAPPLTLASLGGAAASMYLAWNLGTLLGLASADRLPALTHFGLDFVIPLTLIAVLGRWLREPPARHPVVVSALAATLLLLVLPSTVAILCAAISGALAGTVQFRDREAMWNGPSS